MLFFSDLFGFLVLFILLLERSELKALFSAAEDVLDR